MPQNLVAPNINDDLQARLQSMSEQILSRTRLQVIIHNLHLYGDAQGKSSDDQKIATLRKDIGIDLVRDPQRQDISAFTISYSASDPRLAQQVTAEIKDLFISENLMKCARRSLRERRPSSRSNWKMLAKASQSRRQKSVGIRGGNTKERFLRKNRAILQILGLAYSRNFKARKMPSIPRSNKGSISRLYWSRSGVRSVESMRPVVKSRRVGANRSGCDRHATREAEGPARRPKFPLHG